MWAEWICWSVTSGNSIRRTHSCAPRTTCRPTCEGTFLKLDADGRITMSDFIREHTGITSEVGFLGRGQFFQIWEPERMRQHLADVRTRLTTLRQAAAQARPSGASE